MTREALGKCPVCGQDTEVTAVYCGSCDTKIEGHFTLCRFCRLNAEQKAFIEIFIKCRGNIKEVERELGISYPTVKSGLEDAANALGYGMQSYDDPENERRMEILDMLEKGLISVEEALELLK